MGEVKRQSGARPELGASMWRSQYQPYPSTSWNLHVLGMIHFRSDILCIDNIT